MKFGSHEEKFSLAEELHHLVSSKKPNHSMRICWEYYPGEGELLIEIAEILVEMDKEEEAVERLSELDNDDPCIQGDFSSWLIFIRCRDCSKSVSRSSNVPKSFSRKSLSSTWACRALFGDRQIP